MPLDYKTLLVDKIDLHVPALGELATVLNNGMKQNFKEILVEVVDCPDLTQKPFTLAKAGLSGSTKLVEVGGPPYLLPTVQKNKIYELKHMTNLVNSDPTFIIGAGAGPYKYAGVNCEGMFNLFLDNGAVDQHTRIAKVDPDNDSIAVLDILPNTETSFALLANLFFSEGKPGKVLKVYAKTRIGADDFIASIRKSLENYYGDKVVGLGGTFLLNTGKAKQHIMRDFSKTPINTEDELNNWLKFFNMSAPLVAVGTLVTKDAGLDLRVQHFHSFSHHDEGGHYHIDVTPETVEYIGYFNTAEEVYRIDRPVETHQFGRD